MKISLDKIIIILGLFQPMSTFAIDANLQVTEEFVNDETINYHFRNVSVETFTGQQLKIPKDLFIVWKALQQNVPLEVGGGLDFNQDRVLERIKLSLGQENKISYIPDFEVAWHTHPGVYAAGELKKVSLPSPADIQVAILGYYNYWLTVSGKVKEDGSNLLRLRSYSEEIERPLSVELNMVVDNEGVYLYKPLKSYWEPIWNQSLKRTIQSVTPLSRALQEVIDLYYPQVQEGIMSVSKAREQMLHQYAELAHIEIEHVPWSVLVKNGLDVRLDVVELLTHKRKASKSD